MSNITVPLHALVIGQERRIAQSGNTWWQVILKTMHGEVRGFIWNITDDVETNPRFPHIGDIIKVLSLEDKIETHNNIVIEQFVRISKDDLPEDQEGILAVKKATEQEMQQAWDLISDSSFWRDAKHHEFAMLCLGVVNQDVLKISPAATHVHHAYQGGLIVHTAEVLDLCRAMAKSSMNRYSFIDEDVLYVSAILHDIGKAYTYYFNEVGEPQQLATEKSIGHMFYAMNLVYEAGRKQVIDQDFINEVLHCIASHHGDVKYGSYLPVQSIEAGILSRADYVSSRNGIIENELKNKHQIGQPLEDRFRTQYTKENCFSTIGMKKYFEEMKSE